MRRQFLLATATTSLLLAAPAAATAHNTTPSAHHTLTLANGASAHASAHAAEQSAARRAAGWLARQLTNGDHMTTGAYDNPGLTASTALALTAAGVAGTAATKATDWLARPENTAAYLGDGQAESYSGAHAKLALLAISQGRDPEAFGGRKVLTELAALQSDTGRYSDKSQYGDYSNAFTQSLAILALHRTPGKAPAKAVEYLTASQCPDGSFPLNFGENTCEGSVDATGLAVQAMLATDHNDQANRGLTWLAKRQQANGGFTQGSEVSSDNPANANSTGSALQALNAGKHPAAAKATAFLRSHQIDCAGPAEQRGAITYDGTFNANKDPLATADALLGLSGTSMMAIRSTGVDPATPAVDCVESSQPARTIPSATPQIPPTAPSTDAPSTDKPSAAGKSETVNVSDGTTNPAKVAAKASTAKLTRLPVTGTAVGLLTAATSAGLLIAGALIIFWTRRRAQ